MVRLDIKPEWRLTAELSQINIVIYSGQLRELLRVTRMFVLFFEIVFKVIDLLFYLTDNSGPRCRSIEPVTEFTMSVR
jgi:hypothetical protein